MSSKKDRMLADRDVKHWYDNLARGSPITAEVRLRRLSLFCEQNNLTPRELVQLGKSHRKKLEDMIQDYISKLEDEGKSPGYITGFPKTLKSWLEHNEVELKRKVKIRNKDATPTVADERVPTKEELKTILVYGSERAKVSICLMSQAGLRPEAIGNESGTDGLTIGDLPELVIRDGHVEFTRIPTMIIVKPTLSKAGRQYFTFLTKEGCEYLAAYLNKRLAEGEEFTPNTSVVAVTPGYEKMGKGRRNRGSKFIITKNVTREIREAIRPTFKWRPYVLRAYFDMQMLMAESHGKLPQSYRVFFMGHKGDIEARYTTNRGWPPENLIEDIRRAFNDSASYLETIETPIKDRKEMLLEMWRDQAKLYGIDPMKVKIEKQKEWGRELNLDEEKEAIQEEIKKLQISPKKLKEDESRFKNKLVKEDDLEDYFNDGWEMVQTVNSKILVRKRV